MSEIQGFSLHFRSRVDKTVCLNLSRALSHRVTKSVLLGELTDLLRNLPTHRLTQNAGREPPGVQH
jgi:hypothetical protein